MSTLPLFAIIKGKKPRLAKAVKERPLEIAIQAPIADLLRRFAKAEWRWSHFPAGELRTAATGAKLKRMGLKSGWPDLLLIAPTGLLHCLEVKRPGEDLSESQEEFEAWCREHQVPHAVVRSVDEAFTVLEAWGALRVSRSGR